MDHLLTISKLLIGLENHTLLDIRVLFICHQDVYANVCLADALRMIANNEQAARVSQKVRLDYTGAKHPI